MQCTESNRQSALARSEVVTKTSLKQVVISRVKRLPYLEDCPVMNVLVKTIMSSLHPFVLLVCITLFSSIHGQWTVEYRGDSYPLHRLQVLVFKWNGKLMKILDCMFPYDIESLNLQ